MRSTLHFQSSAVTARLTGGANLASVRRWKVYVRPSAERPPFCVVGTSVARSGTNLVPASPAAGAYLMSVSYIAFSMPIDLTSYWIAGSSPDGSPCQATFSMPPFLGVPVAPPPPPPLFEPQPATTSVSANTSMSVAPSGILHRLILTPFSPLVASTQRGYCCQ